MFNKRIKGQITIFLLVSLIILFIVIFVFSLFYSISKEKVKANQEIVTALDNKAQAMKVLVEQCEEDVGESALITLGYRGGRSSLEAPFFQDNTIALNYNYYLGESTVPSLENMEESLEKLVTNNLEQCVSVSLEEQDENYTFQGASITLGSIETDAQITDGSVIYLIKWPITITINTAKKRLEEFSPIEIPIKLKEMRYVIDTFMWQLTINPYFIDTFYLLEQGFSFDIALYNPDTYVFIISDNQTTLNYAPYKFLFAAKINTSKGS